MENEPQEGALVIDLAYIRLVREEAEIDGRSEFFRCIDDLMQHGTTVNLPARQLAAIAETLRPIVETDWQERRQEAGFTPSGVNG
jgi:hypothetical protein